MAGLLRRPSNPAAARRRADTAVVHLGESDPAAARGERDLVLAAAVVRQIRFRWVAAKWRRAAARISTCCSDLMGEVARGRAEIEAAQSRAAAAHSCFAAPFAPVDLANCRSNCRLR